MQKNYLRKKITEIFILTVFFIISLAIINLDVFGVDLRPVQPYVIGLYSVSVAYLILNFAIDVLDIQDGDPPREGNDEIPLKKLNT